MVELTLQILRQIFEKLESDFEEVHLEQKYIGDIELLYAYPYQYGLHPTNYGDWEKIVGSYGIDSGIIKELLADDHLLVRDLIQKYNQR